MAPGFRTREELEATKARPDYWAKSPTAQAAAETETAGQA